MRTLISITAALIAAAPAAALEPQPLYQLAQAQPRRNQALFQADFHEATVVTLYLLPDLNVKLMPRLMEQLKPGSRIVSHQFDMGKWRPDKKVELNGRTIYLWTIPAKKR